MRKTLIGITILATLTTIALIAQNTGTPDVLRVLTDANGYLLVNTATPTLPISQPTQFSNARLKTDASGNLYVTAADGSVGAPTDATYITKTANATLSAEQALSTLSTGLMNVTTTTGAITSIADSTGGKVLQTGTPATWTGTPLLTAGAGTQTYHIPGRLFWEAPATTNPASTNFAFSTEYPLAAGTLASTGDTIEVEGLILLDANTSSITYQCNIGYTSSGVGGFTGGTNIISNSTTTATGTIHFKGQVYRTAATTAAYWAENNVKTSWQMTSYNTANITWANAQPIKCGISDTGGNAARGTIEAVWINWKPS